MDVIRLLPDSVANQIAAGEVIQRPASVVKELVENAIDAKADKITVIIKDAGRTLIQVIDNGVGMSETDARLAFERHATSKISSADDLFALHTKGFRGEALASIAAIAHVELQTKPENADLGTKVIIQGSQVIEQSAVNCQKGSSFAVKNLFFNVPARRRFLKSNATEFSHILSEFYRIVLAHKDIEFQLYNDGNLVYKLPKSNLKQRIINIFGKHLNAELTPIDVQTSIVHIYGFIGTPKSAKKRQNLQFFFANDRFMRNAYFHKAVMNAYDRLLLPDVSPAYFIYFEVDAAKIDVNIHPTKTEINFEDANAIFQILTSAVKESLGKYNITPPIDFDGAFEIPPTPKDYNVKMPDVKVNPAFNPFKANSSDKKISAQDWDDWNKLYERFENAADTTANDTPNEDNSITLFSDETEVVKHQSSNTDKFISLKGKYLITTIKSGLMLIHKQRAYERIIYEDFIKNVDNKEIVSQKILYPIQIKLSGDEANIISEVNDVLKKFGIITEIYDNNIVEIKAIPDILSGTKPEDILLDVIDSYRTTETSANTLKELTAAFLAKASSKQSNSLFDDEMLIDKLFACTMPNFDPNGKKIIEIINFDDIDKLF